MARILIVINGIVIMAFSISLSLMETAAAVVPGGVIEQAGDFTVRDFHFQNGDTLPEIRLHYTTLGSPHRDANGHVTNAVLLLHGTTGTGQAFLAPTMSGELFGPGQPLDATRYYIILPDGIGRGGSSKPSDGLRAHFPKYGYSDVVGAQHLLVREGLGVDRLRLVLGVSMGGMQAWMWAERYPAMMDAVMPIACQPIAISGRNMIFRRILTEAIRNDPDWNGGDYTRPPRHWLSTAPLWSIILDSPVRLQAQAPNRKAAIEAYDRMVDAAKTYDANDFLYWLESSWDYDPQPTLERIKSRVMAVNFADDEINPADLGIVKTVVESVPTARFIMIPASEHTAGHATLSLASVWKSYLEQLLRESSIGEAHNAANA